jgi:precorrin-2 dehydrogenase/sirohydrochlorin ferrochelatase
MTARLSPPPSPVVQPAITWQETSATAAVGSGAERTAEYYPAFLDLLGRRVVVVGGGEVAASKVQGLLRCGPSPLVVVAPVVSDSIRPQVAAGWVQWEAREFVESDLDGAAVVFAVSESQAANARVAVHARARGVLVQAVDDVPNCDFIAPAIARRGGLTVAVSTHGRSPGMARHVREWLEGAMPQHWGLLLEVIGQARSLVRQAGHRPSLETWQAALRRGGELVQCTERESAVRLLVQDLSQSVTEPPVSASRAMDARSR